MGFGPSGPEPILFSRLAMSFGKSMKTLVSNWISVFALLLTSLGQQARAQIQPPIPGPDARYKTDILVVITHPDDDTAVSTYLAKAVVDEGKRVAVVFTNRGNAGPNAVGMEQSKALAMVREMEARRSLAERGITNVWFLNGQDTPTQDVLHSLETLGHGEALESVVRLIRLTRPEVILTWLPAYVAGENHGDHQSSGVVAVEAFDAAGDPTQFAEQLTAPRWHGGTGNYGEGLRPWQAKKLYFFSDASHPEFLKGHGPTYLASDICRSKHISFADINRAAWKAYATQIDFNEQTLSFYVNMPEYLVLGKSLVPSSVEADVWSGVDAEPLAFTPPPTYHRPRSKGIALELGGPWVFYRQFYSAHGLDSLKNLVPPQSALSYGNQFWLPLLLRNDSLSATDVTLRSSLPSGWTGDRKDGVYHLEAQSSYPVELFLTAPAAANDAPPQDLTWTLTRDGEEIGKTGLAVYLEFDGVSQ
jgi:LmbE family N-acetylglucosaminyl deacetylase